MRNIESFPDQSEEKGSYRSILGLYLVCGVFVYLYSIPNIFFVYTNDMWRLFAMILCVSYFIMSAGAAYVECRFLNPEQRGTLLFSFTVYLWSMAAINLYGIQALADHPIFQGVYIHLLWGQLFLILFSWIKWIPVRTRKIVARAVTIALGAFCLFHLLADFNSTRGAGIYVFLFGDVATALGWPGWALFFSGLWTRFIMGTVIDLDITPEERARMIAEEKTREEASIRKVSEEMLSSGRYLEYGELEYPDVSYREKGSKMFEDVEFLYVENRIRYFNRLDWTPTKEMILYKENGQWYCQTTGQEPERVLLSEHLEEEKQEFEIDKREYLEQAIEYRRIVPYFVEIPSDIDESEIDRE
ncbi:hypothetical protein MHB50_19210 [Siminovitchia sp. FSL H7-0308]|uniref:hypothetical protein n=1 Tax=unclassified Siminovitchia TaxID=2837530 RepID=UPI0030CA94CE